jgi:hypothetical protein
MPIARIRIPSGWYVEGNTLMEPIGMADLPPLDDLKEDQLQLSNDHHRVVVDLSWLPEFNPKGRFVLTAVRLENDGEAMADAWEAPLRVRESRSFSEILGILENWLEDETLWQS